MKEQETPKKALAIDLGTSRVKVVVFSENGSVLARTERSYPLDLQPGGIAEQSPDDWIQAVCACTKELSSMGNEIWPPNICSVTGQMHGLVLLDKNYKILRKAIICSDFRAEQEKQEIESLVDNEYILHTTGSPGIGMLPGPKFLWLKKHEPDVHREINKLLFPKDYIGFVMTGDGSTDPSDASGTMLYNCISREWDNSLCEASAVPLHILPKIRTAESIRGYVMPSFAGLSAIPEGTPVIIGGGDLPATVMGTGISSDKDGGISLGTAGIIFRLADQLHESVLGKIFHFCHTLENTLVSMGSCPGTGFSVDWFERDIIRTALAPGKRVGEITSPEAKGIPDLYFLPYLLGTGSPYMDYTPKGAFLGLSHHHKQEDMRRAIYEGISYSIKQSLELLQVDRNPVEFIRVCAGGSYNRDWLQILANIIGKPLQTLKQKDTAVVGAAILGGFAAGWFTSLDEGIKRFAKTDEVMQPDEERIADYLVGYEKYLCYSKMIVE